jgi:hypothetical protein
MKFTRTILAVLLIIPITYGGIYTVISLSPAKKEIVHGKTIPYNDFADMEKETQIAVIGKKLKTSENIINRDKELNQVTDAYSIADFKISTVLNNKSGIDLKKNDVIKVMELSATEKDSLGVTHSYQYEDYESMEVNKKYILYLDESKSDPGVYIIGAVNYGKIPLETEEKVKENKEKILKIHQEAKEKYKDEIKSLDN